jgi:hypothetical protein
MAVGKFCNGLRRTTGPIEFTLEIGTPPVRFVASSGTCTPPAGQACTPIQAGDNVTVSLYLDGMMIGQGGFEIPPVRTWCSSPSCNRPPPASR